MACFSFASFTGPSSVSCPAATWARSTPAGVTGSVVGGGDELELSP